MGSTSFGGDITGCLTELRLPQYPSLARQAKLSGKALVSVKIDEQGKATEIVVDGLHRILQRTVVDSIRLSEFKSSCKDLVVHFQVHFELEQPPKQADLGYVLFRPPNIFVVRASSFPVSGHQVAR